MELREKIRDLILYWSLNGSENPGELADDILAIPEIAEALEMKARQDRLDARNAAAAEGFRPAPVDKLGQRLGHSISANPPKSAPR